MNIRQITASAKSFTLDPKTDCIILTVRNPGLHKDLQEKPAIVVVPDFQENSKALLGFLY